MSEVLDPQTQVATGRICSGCGKVTNQRWRIGCDRCGNLVVTVQTHEQVAEIKDRAYYAGWRYGKNERSLKVAKVRREHRRRAVPKVAA